MAELQQTTRALQHINTLLPSRDITRVEGGVKKPFLAGCAFGALFAPAMAADITVKARAYVPPPPVWTGFDAGFNAGYADVENSVAFGTPDAALGVIPGVSQGLASLSALAVRAGSGSGFAGGGQIALSQPRGSNCVKLACGLQLMPTPECVP